MTTRISRPHPSIVWGALVLAAGLLAWLVIRDASSLDALGGITFGQVAVIMGLQLLYLVPESYRQQIVVESVSGTRLSPYGWFRIFIVGRFLNSLIPQLGTVYRAVRLKRDFAISYTDFGGALAAFLLLSLLLNLLVAAALLASGELQIGVVPAWVAPLLAAGGVVAAAVIAHFFSGRSSSRTSQLLATLQAVVDSAISAATDRRLLVRFVITWLATLVVVVALYGAVFSVVGVEPGFGQIVALYALVQVSSFVVITPGNLGVQELGFAGLAVVLSIPGAEAVLAAALIRATGWVAIAVPSVAVGFSEITSYLKDHRAVPPAPVEE